MTSSLRARLAPAVAAALIACGSQGSPAPDGGAGPDGGLRADAGDAGPGDGGHDAGFDAGGTDGGPERDAGLDAGPHDAGPTDAGADAGLDAGRADGGEDGGPPYPSAARSSWGRVGTVQVFDLDVSSTSQVTQAAPDVDWVWGSASGGLLSGPQAWFAGNPAIIASRYFISTVDNQLAGHDLAWYQANHPDWILYDCDGADNPTHVVAYQPGLPGFVPIDLENPAAVKALAHSAADYAVAHGFNSVAADQVLFFNDQGGQGDAGDDWGCGVWQGSTFVRRYSPTYKGQKGAKTFPNYDPQWNVDMANWVTETKGILASDYPDAGLKLIVNHPPDPVSSALGQQVITSSDAVLDETGFADYGNWAQAPSLFLETLDVMEWAQAHGTAYLVVNKNAGVTTPTAAQLEWSIATYLVGNEGNAYLWTSGASYGDIELFPEYQTVDQKMGTPCGAYYGGPSYSSTSPHLYYRRFTGGLVVVNAGSTAAYEVADLPAGHTYTDLESRTVTNPLDVNSSDAWVLFTPNGCQ